MTVNKLLTKVNYKAASNRKIKYIVIHYVGATGDAKANCKYFEKVHRGSSAHYFVGHRGDIWQCVEDKNIAWHCGAKTYKHKECRNSNSIGIEMCCKKGSNWYFEPETVDSTIELVKNLMKKYNIPAANVIRHFDCTGKMCPEPYVKNTSAWKSFKKLLEDKKEFTAYKVNITADVLNVRTGAGTNYDVATKVKAGEVYTIVAEKMNGTTKWGKLKSGVGWISLSYTEKV